MKSFKTFVEDGGMSAGAAGGSGAIPTNTTSNVSGAGDNQSKTVPVFKKAQQRLTGLVSKKPTTQQTAGQRSSRVQPIRTPAPVKEDTSPRRVTSAVNFTDKKKKDSVVAPSNPTEMPVFMTKEETKKEQEHLTGANSKTDPNPTGAIQNKIKSFKTVKFNLTSKV
jgi:hypothetical protein